MVRIDNPNPDCEMCSDTGWYWIPAYQQGGEVIEERVYMCPCQNGQKDNDEYERDNDNDDDDRDGDDFGAAGALVLA